MKLSWFYLKYVRFLWLSLPNIIQGSHMLEKYLNLEGFLEKSLKIKLALKSTGKSLKSLEKSLNSTTLTQNYIAFKSIYFDDKLFLGVIFFCHWISNALLMSLKKRYWMKIINCIIFMNNSVQRGQNENFLRKIKQPHSIWKQEITDCVL